MNVPTIRIATRASAQAVTQAEHALPADVPLHTIGGQGVFVKEVQLAVLDGRADVAVHSAKDLPTTPHEGLTIGAYTKRRTASDALIGRSLVDLAGGATVATGSVRRRAQLHRARPDLNFAELRGNIHTRLRKVPAGGAIVMAVAALEVLGLTEHIAERLDPAEFVPAVGQGCVAVECRDRDRRLLEALEQIDHRATRDEVGIERAFLAELGSGCSLPVGAHVDAGKLYTFLADERSTIIVSDTIELSGDLDNDIEVAAGAARSARDHVTGR